MLMKTFDFGSNHLMPLDVAEKGCFSAVLYSELWIVFLHGTEQILSLHFVFIGVTIES